MFDLLVVILFLAACFIVAMIFFGIDLFGQKLFKVEEGYGFSVIIMVMGYWVAPLVLLLLVVEGKMEWPEAFVSVIFCVGAFKFLWWDNFFSQKVDSVSDTKRAITEPQSPSPSLQPIEKALPSVKWIFNSSTKILRNNVTGKEYSPREYERQCDGTPGYQINHGPDVWVNDRDIDVE